MLRIYAKSLKYRYVDELQKYKADRIMNILDECRAIKLIKIIADTKDTLCLPQVVYKCQTQNQKEVNHENLTSCKNLDRLPCNQFEKKIPSVPTAGSLTSFVLNSEEKS
jgi:hypothetical protein